MSTQKENRKDTALVLIDVQNSFFHEDGENYYPESATVVPQLRRLLDKARAAAKTIIHVAEQHRPSVEDFESAKLPEHCVVGEFDAQFFEGFGPGGDNEFLLAKRRMSAFCATDLDPGDGSGWFFAGVPVHRSPRGG